MRAKVVVLILLLLAFLGLVLFIGSPKENPNALSIGILTQTEYEATAIAAEPILANERVRPATTAPEASVADRRFLQVSVVAQGTKEALEGASIRVWTS